MFILNNFSTIFSSHTLALERTATLIVVGCLIWATYYYRLKHKQEKEINAGFHNKVALLNSQIESYERIFGENNRTVNSLKAYKMEIMDACAHLIKMLEPVRCVNSEERDTS